MMPRSTSCCRRIIASKDKLHVDSKYHESAQTTDVRLQHRHVAVVRIGHVGGRRRRPIRRLCLFKGTVHGIVDDQLSILRTALIRCAQASEHARQWKPMVEVTGNFLACLRKCGCYFSCAYTKPLATTLVHAMTALIMNQVSKVLPAARVCLYTQRGKNGARMHVHLHFMCGRCLAGRRTVGR